MKIVHFVSLALALAQPTVTSLDYGPVIGIDLGTTYSCVAICQSGRVDIIANDQGNRITPSWVGFSESERLIGDTAKHAFHTMPSQTIFDVKRLIGHRYEDITLQDVQHWPFKVVNINGRPAIEVTFQGAARIFTPQEISAMILGKMKETAEAYLGRRVTHAVITVPAYFNDEQRQATKDAGQIAGLNVLRIINEPTAAAMAYGLNKNTGGESKMIVYDLGGGTFDVSLLRMNDGVFEVLATAGDTHLGGEDFDNRVIDYFVARYQKETGTSVLDNRRAMSKLKRETEKAKRTLSSQLTTRLEIESFEGGKDFSAILTRAKFEELNLDLFKRTLDPISKVLQDKHFSPKDIDDVILVGGSTRIPIIRRLLKDFFGGLEPRMGVNPDEAVAYGAAIQGSILAGVSPFKNDLLLVDVYPFTLGIQTSGGVSSQLIPRNTAIPVQKSEIFSTAADNQRTVLVKVLQGDSTVAKDNLVLGTFKLSGIPPSARGVPQIQVTFSIDANAILTVTACDKDSGSSESITITSERNQLAQHELARMTYEAERLSEKDAQARIRSGALNELQELVTSKRGLDAFDNAKMQVLLDEHSLWAEYLSESAGLTEIIQRIKDVDEISLNAHTLKVNEVAVTSIEAAPSNVDPTPVLGAEVEPAATEKGGVGICTQGYAWAPVTRAREEL